MDYNINSPQIKKSKNIYKFILAGPDLLFKNQTKETRKRKLQANISGY